MQTITQQQRDAIVARDKQLSDWLGSRLSYRPEEVPMWIHVPTNDERAQVELFDFINLKPAQVFCYPSKDCGAVTCWTGFELGKIVHKGRAYRSGFGDKRQSIRVAGVNGVTYSGTIYGTYVRLKAVKS